MEKDVDITQTIRVTIDETKFNESFMKEFREVYYNFMTISDHIKHLAQLYSRGVVSNDDFIEGYGLTDDMGIKFETIDQEQEIV